MGICDSAGDKVKETIDSAKRNMKGLLDDEEKYLNLSGDIFDKYDKDKSGYIEENELKEVINELASKLNKETNISEEHIKKALDQMDTDEDGKISKNEFCNTSRVKLLQNLFNN